VATGHGSEGVILGAGTAQLVAAQLAGDPPPFDASPYDPLRFDA
jgi:glycine/D-amino acid oxidase-like deaminating enzyme